MSDMHSRGRGIHQLTALLVLTIVAAASGLPHWHPTPAKNPVSSNAFSDVSHGPAAHLESGSEADLLECVVCILQRILTQASTESTETPPEPGVEADVEAATVQRFSTPPLRYIDPRGPPSA